MHVTAIKSAKGAREWETALLKDVNKGDGTLISWPEKIGGFRYITRHSLFPSGAIFSTSADGKNFANGGWSCELERIYAYPVTGIPGDSNELGGLL